MWDYPFMFFSTQQNTVLMAKVTKDQVLWRRVPQKQPFNVNPNVLSP